MGTNGGGALVVWASGILLLCGGGLEARQMERPREPIVGRPCEGCEAVFEGLPEELGWSSRIAPETEPGEALRIDGVVYGRDGRPAEGVIVYAYHTDAGGIYPRDNSIRGNAARRHGRLRGWAKTDSQGRYRFDTIRPAGYPGSDLPQHVHMHVIEVGRCTYYIGDVYFDDDPRLNSQTRSRISSERGGGGLATPRRDDSGVWVARRDIRLDQNTPACGDP